MNVSGGMRGAVPKGHARNPHNWRTPQSQGSPNCVPVLSQNGYGPTPDKHLARPTSDEQRLFSWLPAAVRLLCAARAPQNCATASSRAPAAHFVTSQAYEPPGLAEIAGHPIPPAQE